MIGVTLSEESNRISIEVSGLIEYCFPRSLITYSFKVYNNCYGLNSFIRSSYWNVGSDLLKHSGSMSKRDADSSGSVSRYSFMTR